MHGRRLQTDWQEDEETLRRLYRQEEDHQNRTRLQALRLLQQGRSMKEAAQIVGGATIARCRSGLVGTVKGE